MKKDLSGFEFKEIDEEGLETLQVIADAKNFNKWMLSSFSDYCNGRILEIGSGIGNISELLVQDQQDITVSDIRINYREFLASKFPELADKGKVIEFDLVHPEFTTRYSDMLNAYDTVYALNVVEHIEDDNLAISNSVKLLKPGGTLIILVPAFQSLYNQLDKELFHFRRYTESSLKNLFIKNELSLQRSFYFNAAGMPAWFISGKIQKNKTIPGGQMKLYNLFVPIFRLVDKLLLNRVGLSVVCIGTKKL